MRLRHDSCAARVLCGRVPRAGCTPCEPLQWTIGGLALLWGFVEAYEARLGFTLRWRSLYEERCAALADANRARYEEGQRLDVGAAVEIASAPAQA